MKAKYLFLLVIIVLFVTSCVQKSYLKTIVYNLNVSGIKNIKTVGIRGNDKPLNWDNDYEMKRKNDSIYTATVTTETGYLYTECKFTINGEFELKEQNNRTIYFKNKDRLVYSATFNKLVNFKKN